MLRHFGPGWMAYRLRYALARRSGWLAWRETIHTWADVPLSRLLVDERLADPSALVDHLHARDVQFFFTPADLAKRRTQFARFDEGAEEAQDSPVTHARRLATGEFPLFQVHREKLGLPPNWHRNALTGESAPAEEHWSRIGDFDHGDIKVIWDLSRFAFVFDLVRAYARTGDSEWAELFWTLVDDWRMCNHPNRGPNWKCGQEASLRVMAWCFGLFAFLDSPASTPDRVAALVQTIGFSGRRIAANVQYAVRQRNNHGVSEAAGLWTIGLLFPELKGADQYRKQGQSLLGQLACELIYDDGSFAQHSWNYHRLMLHVYAWAMRLGEINGQPLGDETRQRVGRAGDLLGRMIDESTGGVPCYGQDDGSLALPLNNGSYFDYRPAVQLTAAVASQQRRFDSGPWDEDLFWLLGPSYETLPVNPHKQHDHLTRDGGYVALRSPAGSLFTRAATFRHRPAQADMLHVDVWWRGQNMAIDPGTFSYNAPTPWNNPLATAAYHNTVTVNGRDQMTRAGRFLWLPWLAGEQHSLRYGSRSRETSGRARTLTSSATPLCYWQGQHDGYNRTSGGAVHRRGVLRIGEEHWLMLDRLESSREHTFRLHWLFADFPYDFDDDEASLTLHTLAGEFGIRWATLSGEFTHSVVRADDTSPRGWRSRGYQRREPALSLEVVARADQVWFFTLLGPGECGVDVDENSVLLIGIDWQANVSLASESAKALVSSATVTGGINDELVLQET